MNAKVLFQYLFILLLSLNGYVASPKRNVREIIGEPKTVGQATNIIATKILKGGVENNKNFVFSPFGFSTILTILGEGAGDDTNLDIATVLKHPEDRQKVRLSYKNAINNLQGNDPHAAPQFRTWFYIYKNNSIEDSYKEIIETNYYVTVKEIDRDYYDTEETKPIEAPTFASPTSDNVSASNEKSQDVALPAEQLTLTKVLAEVANNSKDITEFDTLKMESEPADETRIDDQKDASKFDEVVEDRQYVEVPVIKDEIQREKSDKDANTLAININDSKDETGLADEKQKLEETKVVAKVTEELKTIDEPEKFNLPLKQFEEMEIMQAQESRLGKAFGGSNDGDGTSIISGNSVVGEKENVKGDAEKYESKMLLFNGLYYRGNWATPFQHLRDEELENVFYTSDEEKIPIKMMRSCGFYRFGDIKRLDSEAIEFPYDNDRYAMLLVVPKSHGGLKKLISELSSNSLHEITSELVEELLDVSLPKFQVETTSGAEKILAKEGLASLFTSKADFSGITKEQKLRVGELQQHVSFRVDEGASSENFLTGTSALRSNAQAERAVIIDRPFLFFVRDKLDDVIVVAGKILSLPGYNIHEPEIPAETSKQL